MLPPGPPCGPPPPGTSSPPPRPWSTGRSTWDRATEKCTRTISAWPSSRCDGPTRPSCAPTDRSSLSAESEAIPDRGVPCRGPLAPHAPALDREPGDPAVLCLPQLPWSTPAAVGVGSVDHVPDPIRHQHDIVPSHPAVTQIHRGGPGPPAGVPVDPASDGIRGD